MRVLLLPLILIVIGFITGSCRQPVQNSNFTEEQIASLQLDSTTILTINTDSTKKVDLNPFLKKRHFDFGSLVKEIKLIPLETTDESLLGNIYKVLVTDSAIYIKDDFKGGGLVIFDRDGKFARRIPNGQGPGELLRLYDIAYDAASNELIAYQHSFLLFFTPTGQFIRQMRLPLGFYNFTVIPGGYVFKTLDRQGNGHLGQLEDYTLLITDKNFKMKSVAMPVLSNVVNYGGYDYLYKNNHTINVTQKFTDTIYQYISEVNHNQLKAKYTLDYSKKKLPQQYTQGSIKQFDNATSQNDYYYYIGEYLETESQNAFFLRNDYVKLKTVIYRDKKSGNLTGGTTADFNMNEIPPIGFPVSVYDDYFINIHLPNENDSFLSNSSIISNEDKQKIKDLLEDDNPILVFFKLKNF
jgi:hypothetical protein